MDRDNISSIRKVNRILCYVAVVSMTCWALEAFIGLIIFGRLPIYGKDPDPYSLSISWLNFIALVPLCISFFTIPISVFLSLDFMFNKQKLYRNDKIAMTTSFLCILAFFIAKYFLTKTFEWVLD